MRGSGKVCGAPGIAWLGRQQAGVERERLPGRPRAAFPKAREAHEAPPIPPGQPWFCLVPSTLGSHAACAGFPTSSHTPWVS